MKIDAIDLLERRFTSFAISYSADYFSFPPLRMSLKTHRADGFTVSS